MTQNFEYDAIVVSEQQLSGGHLLTLFKRSLSKRKWYSFAKCGYCVYSRV